MSDMREAFEEVAARLGYSLKVANPADETGEYMAVETEDAFAVFEAACEWQAARTQSPKMSRTALSKIESLGGGDPVGLLVQNEAGAYVAVDVHGRLMWLDDFIMAPVARDEDVALPKSAGVPDARIDHRCDLCGHKWTSNDLMGDCAACTRPQPPTGQEQPND